MYNQYGAAWQADNLGAPPYDVRITPRNSAPLVASCEPILSAVRTAPRLYIADTRLCIRSKHFALITRSLTTRVCTVLLVFLAN